MMTAAAAVDVTTTAAATEIVTVTVTATEIVIVTETVTATGIVTETVTAAETAAAMTTADAMNPDLSRDLTRDRSVTEKLAAVKRITTKKEGHSCSDECPL